MKIIDAAEFVLCATNCGNLYPSFCHLARFTSTLPTAPEQERYWRAFIKERALGIVGQQCYGRGDAIDMTRTQFREAVWELRRYYHEHILEC